MAMTSVESSILSETSSKTSFSRRSATYTASTFAGKYKSQGSNEQRGKSLISIHMYLYDQNDCNLL